MKRHLKSALAFISEVTTCRILGVLAVLLWVLARTPAAAEDWPAYRHDNRRSGVTSEKVRTPLRRIWKYSSAGLPQTAWPGPAKWDAYAGIKGLKAMRNFDPVFHVTVAGDAVYFGSSADDAVHCLDIATGKEKWVFFTDGPVRLPPAYSRARAYFGSDDGYVYCLEAPDGALVWKYRAAEEDDFVPYDKKLISLWPCRTGALVADDKIYFAASLLPWRPSYLCAVDARTGSDNGPGLYKTLRTGLAVQGAMLASPTKLYLSQGRQGPIVCDRTTGRFLGAIGKSGDGGVFALLVDSDTLVHGHGQNHRGGGELRSFDAQTRDHIATFPAATSMVATGEMAYLLTGSELSAFNRVKYLGLNRQKNLLAARRGHIAGQLKALGKNPEAAEAEKLSQQLKEIRDNLTELDSRMPDCFVWTVESACPHDLILAGNVLFAGGDDSVAAFSAENGRRLWSAPVEGKAHGLAFANGRLLVSTDLGRIHCFAPD